MPINQTVSDYKFVCIPTKTIYSTPITSLETNQQRLAASWCFAKKGSPPISDIASFVGFLASEIMKIKILVSHGMFGKDGCPFCKFPDGRNGFMCDYEII